ESGPGEILRRLSDPYWFQAFGCALGYDWHSSGVTTTVCGAVKEGVKGLERDLGLFVAGGKGRTSRKTPGEIEGFGAVLQCDPSRLVYASRMSAKVDSSALQDGYQLYHHTFFFTRDGKWAVVQQGMNEATRYARRYHWLGEVVGDFVSEPHAAICSQQRDTVLNLVAQESGVARETIASVISSENPDKLLSEFKRLRTLDMPSRHLVALQDVDPDRIRGVLVSTYESQPQGFEALLALPGVGPKTLRALSLISELVYGAPVSTRDPARYSFAHGGKDGTPYPVDRKTYEATIQVLHDAIRRARIGDMERLAAFKRLRSWL
ncbi:MAG: DUF763 domain-containing protein, partial [Chloroflexota bacterium]